MSEVHIPSKPVLYLRAALFWICFSLSTFFISFFLMGSIIFKPDTRLKVAKVWGVVSFWWLKTICKLEYEIEGSENIGDRNAIVFCKHQSTWETIALHLIIPYGRWVFKRELLLMPFFGWALGCTDPIAINRGAGRAAVNQLIKKGTEKLKKGNWINIFPEGTRKKPGAKPDYKIGGALLAADSGYPVSPIAHNAGEYWPRHSIIKWPGTIKVRVGPLIETKGRKAADILEEAQNWIENEMQQISDETRWNR